MQTRKFLRSILNLEKYLISKNLGYKLIHSTSINSSKFSNSNKKKRFTEIDKKTNIETVSNRMQEPNPEKSEYKWQSPKILEFHEWQALNESKQKIKITSEIPNKKVTFRRNVNFNSRRDQTSCRMEAHIPDVAKASLILFPGEGTQYVGMGKNSYDIPTVKNLYEEASEVLGYDIYKLSTEGPAEQLLKTKYQQPAIFLASIAAIERLKYENPEVIENCLATAGFGVGEITALMFGQAIKYLDALRLIEIRASAMQLASDLNPGSMVSIFYGHQSKVKQGCQIAAKICRNMGIEDSECVVANYLFPDCKVIAGNLEGIQFLEKNSEEFGILELKHLAVAGAFNTKLMTPAIEPISEAVENIFIRYPKIPVYSNISGKPFVHYYQIKSSIPLSITRPIKWEQTIHTMYSMPKLNLNHYPTTYECGPGKSLSMLLKKINSIASEKCINIIP